jgi:hypothetical protein
MLTLVQIGEHLLVRYTFQTALGVKSPAMELTSELLRATGLVPYDLVAAMGTDVVEAANDAIATVHEKDRKTRDVGREIVAPVGNLLDASDAQPNSPKDALLLKPEIVLRDARLDSDGSAAKLWICVPSPA